MERRIKQILTKLNEDGYYIGDPHFEIEGIGEPSQCARKLNYFPSYGCPVSAVYVLKNYYLIGWESWDETAYDVDFVRFPRSALEQLIDKALKTGEASAEVQGTRVINQFSTLDPTFREYGDFAAVLGLTLRIADNTPKLNARILKCEKD